ncbi:flagellar hook-length control protein FliK [Colwellia echini]|uniref:Flagellar hook-length control protein-like C-terminal domain-containing protein n=1 Tax=Colwellia echini TaxID=1982103 RepID=A0ABY3MWL8_9GAMM|nr:flagellar hook-length control protein FliK [Colwellia echini]TYK65613.1 hypothetical protein CWS31_009635 [Colwellia echini]
MQSVNVLPAFVSQDTDLKTKDYLTSTSERHSELNFSRLVERHVNEDKKSSLTNKEKNTADSTLENKAESKAANLGNTREESGNKADNELNRQENDSSEANTAANNPKDNNNSENTDTAANQVEKAHLDNANKKNVDDVAVNQGNSENNPNASNVSAQPTKQVSGATDSSQSKALAESEQFMSLLYNSDQTLNSPSVNSTAENAKQLSTNGNPLLSNSNTSTNTSSTDKVVDGYSEAEESLSDDQISNTSTPEHKLKSFSNSELLARGASGNVEDAVKEISGQSTRTQTTEQALKGTQPLGNDAFKNQNLTSDQLMKNQLSNTDFKNNKITDIATGVSQAHKAQVIEPVDAALTSLVGEEISGDVLTSEAMTEFDKEQVNQDTIVKGSLANNVLKDSVSDSISPAVKLEAQNKTSISNEAIESSNEPLSTRNSNGDIDKLTTDKIAASLAAVDNQSKAQYLDAKAQQKMQLAANEKAAFNESFVKEELITESDNTNADSEFSETTLLADNKPGAQGSKTSNQVTDVFTARASTDAQAQVLQAAQSKQTNDAYLEHQTAEVLNHSVATDVAQIQKNNVQLQQETISIFRKDFTDAVKDKVMIMISQKLQQFDITLDPPEFGNMQVRVNLQGEQAAVNFVVQNQQAKDALEQSMHKLKEMLAEQGVDVGDANVEQQNQQGNNDNNSEQNTNNNAELNKTAGNDANDLLSKQNQEERVFSANLFGSPTRGVDYYA